MVSVFSGGGPHSDPGGGPLASQEEVSLVCLDPWWSALIHLAAWLGDPHLPRRRSPSPPGPPGGGSPGPAGSASGGYLGQPGPPGGGPSGPPGDLGPQVPPRGSFIWQSSLAPGPKHCRHE